MSVSRCFDDPRPGHGPKPSSRPSQLLVPLLGAVTRQPCHSAVLHLEAPCGVVTCAVGVLGTEGAQTASKLHTTPQVFHQKVRSVLIAPASVSTLQTLDAIRHFECHNPFSRRQNSLQPELSRPSRLGLRTAAFPYRPALLGRRSGHGRS